MIHTPFPRVVLVDANFLICIISTRKLGDNEHKVRHLLACIEKARGQLVIPTPALSEYLVRADSASLPFLEQLERKAYVRVAPFDRAAAFECSQIDAAALGRKDKRDGLQECWQKVKFDRQIIAIGKAVGAGLIVSSDEGVRANAMRVGIHTSTIQDLPLPDDLRQGKLKLTKGHHPGPLPATKQNKITAISSARKPRR